MDDNEQPETEAFELEISWDDLKTMVVRAHDGEDPEMLFLEYFVNHVITE